MSEVLASESFSQTTRIRSGVTRLAQPLLAVEAAAFDHKCIPIPFSDRVSAPRRPIDFGKRAPIGKDLSERRSRLVEKHRQSRKLHNLYRRIQLIPHGNVGR